jgi:hypothetical protein
VTKAQSSKLGTTAKKKKKKKNVSYDIKNSSAVAVKNLKKQFSSVLALDAGMKV